MDFCYIARRSLHNEHSLQEMDDKLAEFYELHSVFHDKDIRDSFALPRQHTLAHFVRGIHLFGSPNGLCTSITESKHIHAVKQPWCAMNKNNPLLQILNINTCRSKLAAARTQFSSHGMLQHNVLTAARRAMDLELFEDDKIIPGPFDDGDAGGINNHQLPDAENQHFLDVSNVDGDPEPAAVILAKKLGMWLCEHGGSDGYADARLSRITPACSRSIARLDLPVHVKECLPELIHRLLYEQLNTDDEALDAKDVDINNCPHFHRHIAIFNSVCAFFYTPSELCGPGGMHCEVIHSHPCWYGHYEQWDTVLIQVESNDDIMGGMLIG